MKGSLKVRVHVTNLVLFITVVVYLLDKYIISSGWDYFGTEGVFSKIIGLCGGDVYSALSYSSSAIIAGEMWRLFTFLFPHIFLPHILVNMVAFYKVGNVLEDHLGGWKILLLFFVIGILDQLLADALVDIGSEASLSGGASGSIFGFIGILSAFSIRRKGFIKENFPRGWVLYLAFYGLFFTYTMGTWTMAAHNIGWILGILVGLLLPKRYMIKNRQNEGEKPNVG